MRKFILLICMTFTFTLAFSAFAQSQQDAIKDLSAEIRKGAASVSFIGAMYLGKEFCELLVGREEMKMRWTKGAEIFEEPVPKHGLKVLQNSNSEAMRSLQLQSVDRESHFGVEFYPKPRPPFLRGLGKVGFKSAKGIEVSCGLTVRVASQSEERAILTRTFQVTQANLDWTPTEAEVGSMRYMLNQFATELRGGAASVSFLGIKVHRTLQDPTGGAVCELVVADKYLALRWEQEGKMVSVDLYDAEYTTIYRNLRRGDIFEVWVKGENTDLVFSKGPQAMTVDFRKPDRKALGCVLTKEIVNVSPYPASLLSDRP